MACEHAFDSREPCCDVSGAENISKWVVHTTTAEAHIGDKFDSKPSMLEMDCELVCFMFLRIH
jgi:hypothetical protein